MTATAQELVQQMVAAGEWPEPRLLEAILACGEEAVEPLLEVVRRQPHGWPDEAPLCHAIDLLGSLQAVRAIPELVPLFTRYDNETLQSLSGTLGVLGPEAIEPSLALVRDNTLGWYPRTEASTAAILAAGNDPQLRQRIAATLREVLASYLGRSQEATEADVEMVTALVVDLTNLADPQARDLIDAAFKAGLVDTFMIRPQDVAHYYRRGGEEVSPPEPLAWLEEYRELYEEEMESRQQGDGEDEDEEDEDEES